MRFRRALLLFLVFFAGGITALISGWLVIVARPNLLVSSARTVQQDHKLHVVVANFGSKPGQLQQAWVVIRYENLKCGGRGSISGQFRTSDSNGVYVGRFARADVGLLAEEWDLYTLEIAVEDAKSSSPSCGAITSREYLSDSRLVCTITLYGRYQGTGGTPVFMGDDLLPCAPLVRQLS